MKFTRLSHQILVVFAAVVVLSLGISGWTITSLAQGMIADNVVRGHRELARRIAEEINVRMADIRPLLSEVASSAGVRAMDPTQLATELADYQDLSPAISRIYVVDREGQQIARTDGQPLENLATAYGFQVAREGHELVSDVYVPDTGHGPRLTVYLPIIDQGAVVGVLMADVSFARVQAILEGLTLTRGETAVVFAENGRAVAHSRTAELARPPALTDPALINTLVHSPTGVLTGYTDELGRRVVGVHAPVEELGWSVVIQTPIDNLTSEVAGLRRTMAAGLLGGVLLAIVVGWLMARRLTEPIGRLAQATEQVAAGDLNTTVDVRGTNEVGVLAASFNRMVATVKSSRSEIERLYAEVKELNAGLERRVAQRTEELATLNAIARVVSQSLDLEAVLDNVLEKALEVLAFESGAIHLRNHKTSELRLTSHYGLSESFRAVVGQGMISARVSESANPLIIDDLLQAPDIPPEVVAEGYRSLASIPLVSKGQVEGVMTVASRRVRPIVEEDAELLLSIGQQIGVAIENARLYQAEHQRFEEAERRRQVAEGLRDILATLNSNRPLDEVLQHTVTQASWLLSSDACAVYRLQKAERMLAVQAAAGLDADAACLTVPLPHRTAAVAMQKRQPIAFPDLKTLVPNFERKHAKLDGEQTTALAGLVERYRAQLIVPIIVRGELYGGIVFYYHQPRTFSSEEVKLSAAFGDQAALAIENAQLYERAQHAATEEERQRLARELHDAVTQTLFSASLIAEVLPRLWQHNPDEGRRRLEELRELTRGALAEMRTLLLELRPAALTETALGDLLRQLGEAMTGRARVPVTVTVEGECSLPADVQVALYRIAQEALNNAAKHAEATQATVTLRCANGTVELRVRDDGQGFDAQSISPDHLGLGIMRERAQAIGAELTIESHSGQGTELHVCCPATYQAEE